MNRDILIQNINKIFYNSRLNYIQKDKSLSEELCMVKIFDTPIIAISSAQDSNFENLKKDEVIGDHFYMPTAWLEGAKSVISIFLPFTDIIRCSNKQDFSYPSKGWLNGRIEGQFFINAFTANILDFIINNGYSAIAPSINKSFYANTDEDKNNINKLYTSNWSERHVAFVCGLGTMSLSKGIITEKGMAGRLTSIITTLNLEPNTNIFNKYDENCIKCGKCIKNCPVNAISFENGKNHKICSDFLNKILEENSPWYGCGKCQVNVPCEHSNPKNKLKVGK